jgi:hypothetical protein
MRCKHYKEVAQMCDYDEKSCTIRGEENSNNFCVDFEEVNKSVQKERKKVL